MKVLHVTESMGSGVEAAILDYVKSAPNAEHSLLFASRGYHTGELHAAGLKFIVNAGKGAWRLYRQLEKTITDVNPDIVHFHSSWAGLVGRSTLRKRKMAVVYSPHSFFFDRTDLSFIALRVARGAERLLVRRTDVVAAVSPHEEECARELGAEAVYVPNIANIASASRPQVLASDLNGGIPRIVAVGRLSAQKDPDFFIAAKQIVDKEGLSAEWIWVGGGDSTYEKRLEQNGVEVTGWIDRAKALVLIAGASLYVHTAAWEGSPISLLEVEQLGVPASVRSIPSVVSLGYPSGLTDPAALAEDVLHRLRNGLGADMSERALDLAQQSKNQHLALLTAYNRALQAAGKRAG